MLFIGPYLGSYKGSYIGSHKARIPIRPWYSQKSLLKKQIKLVGNVTRDMRSTRFENSVDLPSQFLIFKREKKERLRLNMLASNRIDGRLLFEKSVGGHMQS